MEMCIHGGLYLNIDTHAQAYMANLVFLKTSAKTNINVKEAFEELLKLDIRNSQLFNDSKSPDKSSASQSSLTKNAVKSSKKGPKGEREKKTSEGRGGKRKCSVM